MSVPLNIQDPGAVLATEDFEGVPVLIHEGDFHPGFTEDVPYISVALHGRTEGTYNFALVKAHGGRRRVVPLNAKKYLAGMHGPERSLEELLAEARHLFPYAKRELVAMHDKFDKAEALQAEMEALPSPLSREDYVAACRHFGIAPRPDEALSLWGVFAFPEYGLEELPRLLVDQKRAFAVENERRRQRALEREKAADERDALAEILRAMPVSQTYAVLVPVGTVAEEWVRAGALHSVARRSPRGLVTAEDPALHGAHLAGHEGEPAEIVTVEVRELPRR